MSAFDDLLQANRAWAGRFRPGDVPAPPAQGLAVITCMDARIVPLHAFGLEVGDAHVLRNAGGRVTEDVLRSLAVSTHVYNVRAVAVVHHTECGMTRLSQEELAALVHAATGADASWVDFMAIRDAGRAMLTDVRRLLDSGLLAHGTAVAGYSYDIHTGVLAEVVAPAVVPGNMP